MTLKQSQKALECELNACEIRKSLHGENHAKVAESYTELGKVYESLGEFKKAKESLLTAKKVVQATEGKRSTKIIAIDCYLERVIVSELIFKDKSRLSPEELTQSDQAVESYLQALLKEKSCQDEEAFDCYSNALETLKDIYGNRHPAVITVDDTFGKFYEALQQLQEFDQVIQSQPYFFRAYGQKANMLTALGRHEEAIECYNCAIRIKPSYGLAHSNKGLALVELGRYKEAVECYDKAIELDPYDTFNYNAKASALCDMGQYQEAVGCYDKMIEYEPNNFLTIYDKGKVLKVMGQENEALECFNRAYEISQSGNIGRQLSKNDIDDINALIQDREALKQKLNK